MVLKLDLVATVVTHFVGFSENWALLIFSIVKYIENAPV